MGGRLSSDAPLAEREEGRGMEKQEIAAQTGHVGPTG